jgi:glycosyltransferase involved in cell wall biosynthesis
MRIVMFGGFDRHYARNRVLRLGLRRLGVDVSCCGVAPEHRWLSRSSELVWRWARTPRPAALLVPEFRHKDVPLARLLATLAGTGLVVDPLVSRYDTKVGDWGTTAAGSLQADHNRRIDRAALRFADLVLCDTASHGRYFQNATRIPPERCAVVPVGFDDRDFQPQPPAPGDVFRVAFFGSYLPLHGIDTIVAAAAALRDEAVEFVLIGSGQTFRTATAARAAGARIELLPPLAPPELVAQLRRAHLLLGVFGRSAKTQRVVPNKVYQGLALERALITADTPAIREFFTPGTHLWTVPAADAPALAAAIRRLRDDPELRQRLAAAGARHVHAAYNPECVAARLLDAGQRLLGWEVRTP